MKKGLKLLYRAYILIIGLFGLNKITEAERKELIKIEAAFPRVYSTSETLDFIIKNKASICRFGDAEFDISNHEKKDDPYQRPSEKLSSRLEEILQTPSRVDLIIAIPPFNPVHNNVKNYYKDISFWEWYWLNRFKKISPLLVNDFYGNSFVSRDAVFFENTLQDIKCLWNNKNVVFVVGEGGRFIFEKRLFDNIKSSNKILAPATNAFEDYDRILAEAKGYSVDNLFLISAGPTATVLAFDLCKLGYQALDIGHLSNCFLQFLGESGAPEEIPMNNNNL